jgi:hypothetical protein
MLYEFLPDFFVWEIFDLSHDLILQEQEKPDHQLKVTLPVDFLLFNSNDVIEAFFCGRFQRESLLICIENVFMNEEGIKNSNRESCERSKKTVGEKSMQSFLLIFRISTPLKYRFVGEDDEEKETW